MEEEIVGLTGPGVEILNNNLTQEEWDALCVIHRMTNRLNVGIRFDYDKSIDMSFENGSQIVDESVYLSKETKSEKIVITDFCKCEQPDREPGFSYCFKCNKHVSPKKIDEIINKED